MSTVCLCSLWCVCVAVWVCVSDQRSAALVPSVLLSRLPPALKEFGLPKEAIKHLTQAAALTAAPTPLTTWPDVTNTSRTTTGTQAAQVLQFLSALPRGFMSAEALSVCVYASTVCLLVVR